MKLAQFRLPDRMGARLGLVDAEHGRLLDVAEAAGAAEVAHSVEQWVRGGDLAVRRLREVWERWASRSAEAAWRRLEDVRLLAPLPRPGKIMAIGLNYREHIEEQSGRTPDQPVVFAKFPTAVIGPGETIQRPAISQAVDYEGELAVIVGRVARHLDREAAAACIAGYTILNDVTARDLQKSDRQWVRAKSIDTFCPMGPWVVSADEWEMPPRRTLSTKVNGEERQRSNTALMIHDVGALLSFLSQAFTLEPGDVIATGTPSGVGAWRQPAVFLQEGDVVEITIEGIGTLSNPVR